jgi:hypothetical protein
VGSVPRLLPHHPRLLSRSRPYTPLPGQPLQGTTSRGLRRYARRLGRYGLTRTIGPARFILTVGAAVTAFRERFGTG